MLDFLHTAIFTESIKHIYPHFCKFIHLSFYKELLAFENTYKSIFITRKMPCLTIEISKGRLTIIVLAPADCQERSNDDPMG